MLSTFVLTYLKRVTFCGGFARHLMTSRCGEQRFFISGKDTYIMPTRPVIGLRLEESLLIGTMHFISKIYFNPYRIFCPTHNNLTYSKGSHFVEVLHGT